MKMRLMFDLKDIETHLLFVSIFSLEIIKLSQE